MCVSIFSRTFFFSQLFIVFNTYLNAHFTNFFFFFVQEMIWNYYSRGSFLFFFFLCGFNCWLSTSIFRLFKFQLFILLDTQIYYLKVKQFFLLNEELFKMINPHVKIIFILVFFFWVTLYRYFTSMTEYFRWLLPGLYMLV